MDRHLRQQGLHVMHEVLREVLAASKELSRCVHKNGDTRGSGVDEGQKVGVQGAVLVSSVDV